MQPDADPAAENQPPRVLVMAQGTFNQASVEQYITEHGGVMEDYHGKHLLIRRPPPAPPAPPQAPEPPQAAPPTAKPDIQPRAQQTRRPAPEMAIGFVQPDVIAVGTVELVRQALDAPANAANVTSNAEMMSLLRDDASSNAWVVGRFDAFAAFPGASRSWRTSSTAPTAMTSGCTNPIAISGAGRLVC